MYMAMKRWPWQARGMFPVECPAQMVSSSYLAQAGKQDPSHHSVPTQFKNDSSLCFFQGFHGEHVHT